MGRKILFTLVLLAMAFGCEGPETTVTNYVNRDGSVIRKAELRYSKNELEMKDFRVPVDSSWLFRDSLFISEEGDTTWFLLAEKFFESADAINEAYLSDTGRNRAVPRSASFHKGFRWFTTVWQFTEKCGKSLEHGYPAEKFLAAEELEFMKLPKDITEELLAGPDSVKYKALSDSMDIHTENWLIRSLISEWIEDAGALCSSSGKDTLLTRILRAHEADFGIPADNNSFDSLCTAVLGDSTFQKYKTELDSAMIISEAKFDRSISFSGYTMQIVMPEEVRSSNGYTMPGGETAWPVRGELFLSDDYVMQAESRRVNYWAFLVAVLVLLWIPAEIKKHTSVFRRKASEL